MKAFVFADPKMKAFVFGMLEMKPFVFGMLKPFVFLHNTLKGPLYHIAKYRVKSRRPKFHHLW